MVNPADWTVLIVDDEIDNVGVLELVFDFHSATTLIATSGPECLKILQTERPSFLLVDIQMPEMSGIDLLKIIRADERWKTLPVIAVTAHAMSGDEDEIRNVGFNGYIPKPIDVTSLVNDLIHILETS